MKHYRWALNTPERLTRVAEQGWLLCSDQNTIDQMIVRTGYKPNNMVLVERDKAAGYDPENTVPSERENLDE